MANGRAHAVAADLAITAGVIGASVAIGASILPPVLATAAIAGLVIGKYANPDVRDQERVRNHAEHLIHRKLGCVAGTLWTLIWWPLAKAIPHRHWTSHLPGIATVIAAVWLYWLPLTAIALYAPQWIDVALWLVIWTLPGWVVQDTIHLIQDKGRVRW